MRIAFADPAAALRRFHAILDAICPEPAPSAGTPWLRLAALAAVGDPGGAEEVAMTVRASAQRIASLAGGENFADPSRFLAAATLARTGIDADRFARAAADIRSRLREAGSPVEGVSGDMAVLALRLRAPKPTIAQLEIARVHALHEQMRRRHWWTSVPEDLPACSVLAGCRGAGERLEADVEAAYLALLDHGYAAGVPLHAAAALLPLVGVPAQRSIERFLGVAQAFSQFAPQRAPYPPALALLSLLEHEPEAIAEQFRAIDAHLASTLLGDGGPVDVLVTAGLTFLELAPFQRDGTVARSRESRRRLMDIFHAALVMLAPVAIVPAQRTSDGVLED